MNKIFSKRRRLRVRLFFEGLIVGSITGTIIAALRFLTDEADIYRPRWLEHLASSFDPIAWLLTLAAIVSTAFFIDRAIKNDAQISGSGVPQLKGILQGSLQMIRPLRLISVKFVASVLAIGEGMSLGRAGLSAQFGACIGTICNGMLGRAHVIERNFLLTAGAGAGFAAIFNAPLAGVIFCIEEFNKKFSSELLLVSMTAACTASAVVEFVFGIRPVFETITPVMHAKPLVSTEPTIEMIGIIVSNPIEFTAWFVLLGAFTGVLGALFTRSLLFSLDVFDRSEIKGAKKYLIPLAGAVGIGLFLPQVLGCGNVLVDELLSGNFAFRLLLIFFLGKFLFTLICFGTGAPGGIFLPLLVLGALAGKIFSTFGSSSWLFGTEWAVLFTIFGMAGFFAAVVKAPITGSILIMELTGSFSHLMALIIVSGVAFLISDLCGGRPVYSALLDRSLHR